MADVTKLLLMAEELLIVSWSQVNEEERAQLSAALEIVKKVRTNRAVLEVEQPEIEKDVQSPGRP